jgi:rhodanese-related sulfurtransferase
MPTNTQEPYQRIGVDQAKRLIDEGVTLIDVREPREIPLDGKIPGSKLVPLNSFIANPRQHLGGDNVLFYCKVGQRSAVACEMAAAVGLNQLYNLEGGIEAWKKHGQPVEYR